MMTHPSARPLLTAFAVAAATPTCVSAGPRLAARAHVPGRHALPDPAPGLAYVSLWLGGHDAVGLYDCRRRHLRWRVPVEDAATPVAVIGRVVICAPMSGRAVTWAPLLGLDRRTGRKLWAEPAALAHTYGMVGLATAGGLIVEASASDIHCLRVATGQTVWARHFGVGGVHWPHNPVVAGDTVYTQTTVGGTQVVALRLSDGRVRWRHRFPWGVSIEAGNDTHRVGPTAVASRRVVGVVPGGPQGIAQSQLVCWRARTGLELWRRSVPWTNDPLVVTDGVVCRIGVDNEMHGFALSNGTALWSHVVAASQYYSPWQAYRGQIIAGLDWSSDRAEVVGIAARDGQVRWRVALPSADEVDRFYPGPGPRRVRVTAWASGGGEGPLWWLCTIESLASPRGGILGSEPTARASISDSRHVLARNPPCLAQHRGLAGQMRGPVAEGADPPNGVPQRQLPARRSRASVRPCPAPRPICDRERTYLSQATYLWDPSNRLAVIQDGSYVLTNTYCPDGMRHRTVDNFTANVMVWDKNDVLATVDDTGALVQFFTRGARAVKRYNSPSSAMFYHCDALGTMQAYSKPDGSTFERVVLDAWGGNTQAMGVDVHSYVGDAGYWGVGGLHQSLYYVRARWLVAGGPGWLSPDPASLDLLRRFMYVENCPTRLVDPSGLASQVVIGFDDSPRSGLLPPGSHPESTEEIRWKLRSAAIKATFFVIGQRFDRRLRRKDYPWNMDMANPGNDPRTAIAVLNNLLADEHILGNHTYCHESSWWPSPRSFPDGHRQDNKNPCDDPATCSALWQIEVCRTQLASLDFLQRWLSQYRTPGLNWDIPVITPICSVLRPCVYLGDNSNDPGTRRTVYTLHDEIDTKTGRSADWADIRGQVNTFLLKTQQHDRVYIFMHDQPNSGNFFSNVQPRGLALLQKLIAYLSNYPWLSIVNAPNPQGGEFGNCSSQLRDIYNSVRPELTKARAAFSGNCPKLG